MKNKKKTMIMGLLSLTAITCLLTGCGKDVTLKNGEKAAVTLDDVKISSDDLYKKLKDKYGINILVDMIDHKLFDEKYKTDSEETTSIEEQISQIKANYGDNETTYLQAIQSYFGAANEEELKKILSLEYKRNKAVIDHLETEITENQIDTYYKENISGKITAKHILIKPDTTSDMSDEEIEKSEKKALEKAKDIIKKLDKGEDFSKLAKDNSEDSATAKDGGKLEVFDHDSNMDEAFFKAAVQLKKGKYTKEPVKSEYGYHIILKEKEGKKPSLKDVKDTITETLAEQKLESDNSLYYQSLIAIREKLNIKFEDDSLKKDYDELMNRLIENVNSSNTNQ